MPRTRRPHPPEFREQLVALVRAGRTPEDLAGEFEPTAQSMGRRCRRPLLGHGPSGQTGCRVHRRRTMTDRSVARTRGQSSYGSGHHPPAPISVTERPRQAAE